MGSSQEKQLDRAFADMGKARWETSVGIGMVNADDEENQMVEVSMDEGKIMYYGEVFRGGVWLRVTEPCKTGLAAKRAVLRWRAQNPR